MTSALPEHEDSTGCTSVFAVFAPSPGGQTTEQVSVKGKAESLRHTVLDSIPQLPITKHVRIRGIKSIRVGAL